MMAWVPWRSGVNCELLIVSVRTARPSGVTAMLDTLPIELPATSTWSPLTIWLAFWKTALTS